MPGLWHDSGNELFKDDPEFARRLFRLAGVDLPLPSAAPCLWS
jgi:hypothetical protein